ncbi:MAG: hypothetical protein ACYTHK_16275 [Planctomycetota bacterium]|jgi:hypothetical protein
MRAQARTPGVRTLVLLLLASPLFAGDAANKAIAFLEKNVTQLPDSSGTPRKQFVYATTGLVYLMDPSTRTGPSRIKPLKEYLVRYVGEVESRLKDRSNLPERHGLVRSDRLVQYTWPLAQTLWFFGELKERGLYGKEMKRQIPRIVAILERAQDSNGGWGHGEVTGEGGGYPSTLLAASNTVAIALGRVGPRSKAIVPAQEYYRKAQLPNGAFAYDPSQRSAGPAKTNPSRTAGSIYAMHCLGMPRDKAMEKSIDYILSEFEYLPEGHGSSTLNLFHAALACHAIGQKEWKRFKDEFFPRIVKNQDEDGHLACICEEKAFGATNDSKDRFQGRMPAFFKNGQRSYTTSLHAFILLLEKSKLKLHEPMKKKRINTRSARRKR